VARRFSFFKGEDAQVIAKWVGKHIPGGERGFGPCLAAAVFEDGQIIGGIIYHNYDPESQVIELSGAGKDWLGREYLHAVYDYIFNVAGCQMTVMRIAENNVRMRRIAERFGYAKHFIPRLRGPDEGEFIMTLTKEDWQASRFNRERAHG